MCRRLFGVLCLVSVAWSVTTIRAEVPSYYDRFGLLLAPPAVFDGGLAGFSQPANLAFLRSPELRWHWGSDARRLVGIDRWGAYGAIPHVGFGVQQQRRDDLRRTDYRLGIGWGDRGAAFGASYGWAGGDTESWGGENLLTTGAVLRPVPHVSVGLAAAYSLESRYYDWAGEVGVRPLGTPAVTLFADAAWTRGASLRAVPWSAGVVCRLTTGVDLVGRYFDPEAFSLGIRVNLGHQALSSQARYDRDGAYAGQGWGVRIGGLKPGVASTWRTGRSYVSLSLRGRLSYLKYRLFDPGVSFFELLTSIDAAAADPRIGAIALQLSGARIAPALAWELREALARARLADTRVVVFIDQAGMIDYHLASVADLLVMDPVGMLLMPGYALNRTYFKGTLAKLGLAFDEWRFFSHKSAVETLSRDGMSEADREQRQAFVDDWYSQTRADVCGSRGFSAEYFDRLVDERALFNSDSALSVGLVDTLARWSDRDRILSRMAGRTLRALSPDALMRPAIEAERWGTPPQVAVVYGLGACAMDTGIRARWLEQLFRRLAHNPRVVAVVFRVDSPGGDGMASDLVAESMRACSERKPVVVSQGQVAASGGYWISMNADSIFATPSTLTGSIGVIGGWLYDDGLGDRLGLTFDYVKRGAHADYTSGIRLPLLKEQIPGRNLTTEEREKVEALIVDHYRQFVLRVAAGRHMSEDEVDRLGQGRVYSGSDGREVGLVDELGGLQDAIGAARRMAGLGDFQEAEIVEYPASRGLFRWPWESASLLPAGAEEDRVVEAIRILLDARGRPLPMVLPGEYPEAP